jgi:hypothetical protein
VKHADVHLQPWQVFYARDEAVRRHEEQSRIGARTGTTAKVGLDSLTAHEIGAVCELATAVYTGIPERFFDENDMNAPDVGLIEVRGTRKQDGDLRVYKPDVAKAEFMVLATLRECSDAGAIIRLEGWAWSEHAWNYSKPAPFPPHPKRGPAHYFSRTSLRPMTTLVKTHRFMEAS